MTEAINDFEMSKQLLYVRIFYFAKLFYAWLPRVDIFYLSITQTVFK